MPTATDTGSETAAELGCPYQHRCFVRKGRSICAEEMPALRPREGGNLVACHFSEELVPAASPA